MTSSRQGADEKAWRVSRDRTMANASTSRILLWVNDTVIVARCSTINRLLRRDAISGAPIEKRQARVSSLELRQIKRTPTSSASSPKFKRQTQGRPNHPRPGQAAANHQWLITANVKGQNSDRFAFRRLLQRLVRPTARFRIQRGSHFVHKRPPGLSPREHPSTSRHGFNIQVRSAGRFFVRLKNFTVRIHDPKGEKVFEKVLTCDEFGGSSANMCAGAGAHPWLLWPAGTRSHRDAESLLRRQRFRVEEYKKPEYEVKVTPDRAGQARR